MIPRERVSTDTSGDGESLRHRLAEEADEVADGLTELREELAGAAEAVREDIADSPLARRAIAAYLWVMD